MYDILSMVALTLTPTGEISVPPSLEGTIHRTRLPTQGRIDRVNPYQTLFQPHLMGIMSVNNSASWKLNY